MGTCSCERSFKDPKECDTFAATNFDNDTVLVPVWDHAIENDFLLIEWILVVRGGFLVCHNEGVEGDKPRYSHELIAWPLTKTVNPRTRTIKNEEQKLFDKYPYLRECREAHFNLKIIQVSV